MDQEQKRRIDSIADEVAREIRAQEFAELLQMNFLITDEKVDNIMASSGSNYLRVVRMLNEVRDCPVESAYENLVQILEELESSVVPKLNYTKPSGSRNILSSLLSTFKTKNKYPLGLNSGPSCSQSNSYHGPNASIATFHSDISSNIASPLKEKHQTTLITSDSYYNRDGRHEESDHSNFRLQLNNPNGPPITPISNSLNGTRHTGLGNNHASNKSSQTPHRLNELNLNTRAHDTSLPEEEDEQQQVRIPRNVNSRTSTGHGGRQMGSPQLSDGDEPVVSWHPYAQSPGHEDALRASSPHHCHTCYSSASSESGESSSESVIVDPNLILDPDVMTAIAREGPNMMSVRMATTCHDDQDEDYKMTARPRGLCLIVNNINFEGDIFPTRKGSDEDANRFDCIFRQLGFETIMTRNLTAEQMRTKFQELSAACKKEHDALFVFILSHGSEHGIYGTDGIEVYLESEIISCFDNRNCKAMIGKPKVFVIQACRGRSKDCGGEGDTTDSIAWTPASTSPQAVVRTFSQENRVPHSWLPSSQPSDSKKRKHPIRTDMLLVFSCLAGFVSVRNETAGSWLGVALAYFIMTHAHERDLLRILNLVTSDIIQRESSQGHIQSIELKLLGWTKNLYFNPGIYL